VTDHGSIIIRGARENNLNDAGPQAPAVLHRSKELESLVIDLGPGAGHDGGRIVFEGTPEELVRHPESLTGRHLALRHA
jgi:excinuclease UvrABC ATPase subunit